MPASTTAQPPPVSTTSSSPHSSKKFSTIGAFVSKSSNGSHNHHSESNERSTPSVKSIFSNSAIANNSMESGQQQNRILSNSRGEDGPWSVSVAAADPPAAKQESSRSSRRRGRHQAEAQSSQAAQPAYTLYITTPTHNLTLQRTVADVYDLDAKIRDGQSSISTLPQLPNIPNASAASASTPPPTSGSRRILQTISRTLSPGGARNRVALGQITSSLVQQNSSSSSSARAPATDYGSKSSGQQASATLKMPKPRRGYGPTGVIDAQSSTPGEGPDDEDAGASASKKVTSALAEYFTTLANIPAVRKSKPFRRFVRVGSDDLQSVRVERRIHRVRSDLAKHVKHSVAPKNTNVGIGPSQSDVGEDGGRTDDERDAGSISARSASRQSNGVSNSAGLLRPGSSQSDRGSPKIPARSGSSDSTNGASAAISGSPTTASINKRNSPNFAGIPEEVDKEKEGSHGDHGAQISATPDTTALTGTSTVTAVADTSADSSAIEHAKKRDRRRKRRDADKVTVDDFEMIRVLGKGCAGKVLLVKHRPTTSLFAMKAIHKKHVLAHQELQHTLTEQAVLKRMAREVQDPFVVKLWWSFHDKNNLYLVMDFHPGGDLATQLSRWGRLGRDRARFYAAEIVEGVEGLHKAGVVYRDLKPENVLIGSDGHIVLSDFGLSKEFPSRAERAGGASTPPPGSPQRANSITEISKQGASGRPHWMSASEDNTGRSLDDGEGSSSRRGPRWGDHQQDMTSTFCGTAEYLAPEVIQGSAYSYEVDWWSFGTMLYEMLTGITPFWADTHADMYVRVLHDELVFPDDRVLDHDTKSILRGLLQRSPQLRMKEPRIKRHPYFSMIEWAHVFHKRYIPPYIPPIDPLNAMDTQNFDEAFLDMQPVVNGDDDEEAGEGEVGAAGAKDTKASNTDGAADAKPAKASAVEKKDVNGSQTRTAVATKAVSADGKSLFDGYSFRGRKDSGSIRSSARSDSVSVAPSGTASQATEVDASPAGISKSSSTFAGPMQPSPAAAIVNAHKAKHAPEKEAAPSPAKVGPTPASPRSQEEQTTLPPVQETAKAAAPVDGEDSEDDETAARNALRALAALEREASADTMSQTSASVSTRPTSIGVTQDERAMSDKGGMSSDDFVGTGPASSNSTAVSGGQKGTSPSGPLRGRTSGLPTHETIAETDDEEEDWDLIDTPRNGDAVPSEANGGRGQNLFSRGVVDTYRLLRRQDSTRLGPGSGIGGMSTPPRPFSRLSRRHRNHLQRPSRGDLTSGSAASLDSTSASNTNANTSSRALMTPSSSTNIGGSNTNNNASTVTFDDQQAQGTVSANAASAAGVAAPPALGRLSASIASSEDVHQSGGLTLSNTGDKRQSRIKRRFTTFFEQAAR